MEEQADDQYEESEKEEEPKEEPKEESKGEHKGHPKVVEPMALDLAAVARGPAGEADRVRRFVENI